jgi:hypothetical protein
MDDLKARLSAITQQYGTFKDRGNPGQAWALSTSLSDLETALREDMQARTKPQIDEIINKLKTNQALTTEDLQNMKLWIVGDSEHYARLENNYQDWMEELQRLMTELQNAEVNNDIESGSRLRALLLDAIRVLGDIVFFLEQKERVANFDDSTREIDDSERDLLISILEGKARSTRF